MERLVHYEYNYTNANFIMARTVTKRYYHALPCSLSNCGMKKDRKKLKLNYTDYYFYSVSCIYVAQ